ncbi:MAG TPA: hypothetical protein VHR45_05985 [Thermoanaerobaculia bacterium]|nr:hypothetical protein [Thermoanaerobaculia bacterium]
MNRKALCLLALLAVILATVPVAGCRSRTDRTTGAVLLTFGTITGIPAVVSTKTSITSGFVAIGTFILQSIVKDPTGTTSALQDIEVSTYQVVYTRRDSGTRVPPTLVANLQLAVPVNGSGTINNLPIVRLDQLLNPPLNDLAQFGFDQETKTTVITIDCAITFFGHTLSGDAIASSPAKFTLEFTP